MIKAFSIKQFLILTKKQTKGFDYLKITIKSHPGKEMAYNNQF